MYLMRIYDELKDIDTDVRLAKTGDPRFSNRPIVTGAVLKEDIVFLQRLLVVSVLGLNALLINSVAFYGFLLLFVVVWLSSKWFFMPSIANNLLLALITHNPIAALQTVYVFGIFAAVEGPEHLHTLHAFLLVGLWFPVAAWETSRKIRLPDDETDYQTYSSMLGWRQAACLPLLFSVIASACLAWVGIQRDLPAGILLAFMAAALLVVYRCLLLCIKPTQRRTRLKPYVEAYAVAINASLIVGALHSF